MLCPTVANTGLPDQNQIYSIKSLIPPAQSYVKHKLNISQTYVILTRGGKFDICLTKF